MTSTVKFIATADVHLEHKLYNMPELEQDMREIFVEICSMAIAYKVNYLVVVGDLYEHNQPRPDTIAFVKGQVARLKAAEITVVGIAGDHDKPVNGDTWCQVSDIAPVTTVPQFFGYDYFDYSQEKDPIQSRIQQHRDKQQVEWIFLHGQVPTLFAFTEDKKKLDFTTVDVFSYFPNLRGILLGDIHTPLEASISDKGKKAYIGFCGSPGITDISETKFKHSVLYFDGVSLEREQLFDIRSFVKINLVGEEGKNFEVATLIDKYKNEEKKPIFIVRYDSSNETNLSKIRPLYELGHVKKHRVHAGVDGQQEELVSLRSELTTNERITAVLKEVCKEPQLYDLSLRLVSGEDPKFVLDEFQFKSFE